MSARREPARGLEAVGDGFGRPVPRQDDRRPEGGHADPGAGAPHLEHGCQDFHRFLDAHEQRTRSHRGPSPVRNALRSDRGGSAAPERHPFHGGVHRRLGTGSSGHDRYAHSHSICSLLSRAVGGSRETARFSDVGLAGICGARCGYVPLSFSGSSCR